MKLIIAVVQDDDARPLMDALADAGFGATKLASTGGFLLQGNTTLLLGVDDQRVDACVDIIRRTCGRRKKVLPHPASNVAPDVNLPVEIEAGGAILFILSVDAFLRV